MSMPQRLRDSPPMPHDEIKKLLQGGHADKIETETGQLPLHAALLSKQYGYAILKDMLNAYPESAKIKDQLWRLPLHCALEGTPVSTEFIKLLIGTYPAAAMMVDTKMYLPLHVAMETSPAPPIQVVSALLDGCGGANSAWPAAPASRTGRQAE
jgi:hypothetical protein